MLNRRKVGFKYHFVNWTCAWVDLSETLFTLLTFDLFDVSWSMSFRYTMHQKIWEREINKTLNKS